jgi:hypothetical protein
MISGTVFPGVDPQKLPQQYSYSFSVRRSEYCAPQVVLPELLVMVGYCRYAIWASYVALAAGAKPR